MTSYDPEYFQEKFPNLFEEIKDRVEMTEVDGVRTNKEEAEKAVKPERSSGPTVVDFLRLCDDEEEALNIINYMEEEGRIDSGHAGKLRAQLTKQGLRSFGSKRDPGEYDPSE